MDVLLAQTNLQLYGQMRAAGFAPAEVQTIQRDYETACLLFAPLCRSTGRPFLCHAVGTASAAIIEGAGFLDVRAALLHAAYKHGRFPDHGKRRTSRHSAWMVDRTGAELEQLLTEFSRFRFGLHAVRQYLATEDPLDDRTLRLVRLKLANDVDDSHAFGTALGHKNRYLDNTWLQLRADMAAKYGFPFFERAFVQAMADREDAAWLDTTTEFERRGHIRSIPGILIGRWNGTGYC
ncbi:MAG: hypothetical protein AAFR35_07725 [Pseudomonadota bacterium]